MSVKFAAIYNRPIVSLHLEFPKKTSALQVNKTKKHTHNPSPLKYRCSCRQCVNVEFCSTKINHSLHCMSRFINSTFFIATDRNLWNICASYFSKHQYGYRICLLSPRVNIVQKPNTTLAAKFQSLFPLLH